MNTRLPLLQWHLIPLWIGFLLITTIPFLSILRVGPLSSFFLESGSLLFVLIFVFLSACISRLKSTLPAASIYFLILAFFWTMQARLMQLTYVGLSDMVAWTFVILALAMWACRSWVKNIGQEATVAVLAWSLFWGGLCQALVAWLQFTGKAAHFSGILMYRPHIVEGQLAQRNHLGHYLMWGTLATAWLGAQKRLTWILYIPALLYFSATMGIVSSRSIFGYILALCILLPLWRILAGKNANAVVIHLSAAIILVAFWQFAADPILQLINNLLGDHTLLHLSSAADRMGKENFGASARQYEWRKAWHIFLSAPWFGYGWGSYALQGFLINGIYPNDYRPYENNVLFTHSHNSFLNILAEMGLIGAILIFGGLLYCLKGCWQHRNNASILLLSLMSVSLVHSTLEYPLWYIYFLSVFALFIGLMPSNNDTKSSLFWWFKWQNIAIGSVSIVLIMGILRLGFAYQNLRVAAANTRDNIERAQKIAALLHIAHNEPMFKYYAQLSLVDYINTNDKKLPDWAYTTAHDALQYRPYSNAYKWGLVAYRNDNIKVATQWMQQIYRYYPARLPQYATAISSPYYEGLKNNFTHYCQYYYDQIKRPAQCSFTPY